MCARIEREGEYKVSKEGYKMTIIRYGHCDDMDIKFENNIVLTNRQYSSFKKGNVSNPLHPTVFNVGYLGVGKYKSTEGEKSNLAGETWRGIIKRGYYTKFKEKQPTYKDVTVCLEWHGFQVFADWFYKNWKPYMTDWHLDKDILVKGNKIYSPETCCFVPQQINKAFMDKVSQRGNYPIGVSFHKYNKNYMAQISIDGIKVHIGSFSTPKEAFAAYKTRKENYVRVLANRWRNEISEETYEKMSNYKIDITD